MELKDKLNIGIKALFLLLFAYLVFNWVACKQKGSCPMSSSKGQYSQEEGKRGDCKSKGDCHSKQDKHEESDHKAEKSEDLAKDLEEKAPEAELAH